MKNKKIIYIVLLCVIFLYACGGDDGDEPEAAIGAVFGEVPGSADDGGGGNDAGEAGDVENSESNESNENNENNEDIENSIGTGDDIGGETETENHAEQSGGENRTDEPEPAKQEENNTEDALKELAQLELGYFVVETPAGGEPVANEDGTVTLPGGGIISSPESASRFEVESGAVLKFDSVRTPFKLHIEDSPFRLLHEDSMEESKVLLIESSDGFYITIDGLEEELRAAGKLGPEPKLAPWEITFDKEKNAVFQFRVNSIKFVSLDSVFPMYKDEDTGVILFKKCRIEFPDGTVIDAPLNTKAQIDASGFKIIIGEGAAAIRKPDGTTSTVPAGTVLDGNIETGV